MNLQNNTFQNNCLPLAFANACDISIHTMMSRLPHNDIVWPERNGCRKWRGWHPQECMLVAYDYGFTSMMIESEAAFGNSPSEIMYSKIVLDDLMNHNRTVLITDEHAVACDGVTVYDVEKIYPLKDKMIYKIVILLFPKSNQRK